MRRLARGHPRVILPHVVQSPLLRSVPGFYHAFAGVDPARRGSREILRQAFSVPPSRVGTLRQIHSGIALEMEETDGDVPGRRWRVGDAIWTAAPGTGVGVRTADCVPVLLAHRELPVCAAIHAGWRGLVAGVVEETVRCIAARFGQDAVSGLVAAAGPSAKGCCYEVGEEVAGNLGECPGGPLHVAKGMGAGKWNADLPSLALEALFAAGLPRGRAEAVGPCTVCSPRFHSFRREKSLTGRQLSFIYKVDFSDGFTTPTGQETR
ncbi:MAG: laccase domain-containing protein [Deltaproteobacteria bacterium]|nr:laccase domain-containing protein [Deltaproteobacteria bacterium]